MQKIMFNDKFGLTQAVLEGRKTMTRRAIKVNEGHDCVVVVDEETGLPCLYDDTYKKVYKPHYSIGETVAVAQSYETLANSGYLDIMTVPADNAIGFEFKLEYCGGGCKNKMFVRADLMPHQIRITDIKVERLRDISDEDCLKEGILKKSDFPKKKSFPYYFAGGKHEWDNSFSTPREAFAALIDKVSGKGTWEKNPYCFCYEFELVK